ncbi:nitrous oxide reductase family maturation protein NosD [Colwellia echini]|uniref:nitrous oxide reductase family maturation protein NosD n=1 Tax=Colwellia echini TaxID=1982103 RepID=UPI001FE59CCC|nr:nitrous oxide reductase family maturation protein NosD [Colwellia echini]
MSKIIVRPFTNLLVALVFFLILHGQQLSAQEYLISPANNLQDVLDNSQDGDVITLKSGVYFGNFIIEKQITLRGDPSTPKNNKAVIIDAQNIRHGLWLKNSNITIENLTIINWGDDLTAQNSGIYSSHKIDDSPALNITILHNLIIGDGFGIWLEQIDNSTVSYNRIKGNLALSSADRGNGIQITKGMNNHVFHNEISETRDGIYIISSENNIIEQNTVHHLRYGVHYMYSEHDSLINNIAYQTDAGYALMSSNHLTVTGNKTFNSEDYGFLLNFLTESTLNNNHIKNVWPNPGKKAQGREGKGLFIYNSSFNTLKNNIITNAEIGIHLTAGSENSKIFNNSFIDNPTPVKYVSNNKQHWSHNHSGNYWSNYLGWDINNDGIGDTVFEPNDNIDKLAWQYPEMQVIIDSPAILILRWIQRQFPVLKPQGIKDSYPLMNPPVITVNQDSTSLKDKL